MIFYFIGYFVALALGILSLYVEYKTKPKVNPPTVQDALLMAAFSLLSWLWAFICCLIILRDLAEHKNLFALLDKELFK